MDSFKEAIDILARNGSVERIERGVGELDADSNVVSMDCRVYLQGIFRKDQVKQWLTIRDTRIGIEAVPSDEFELCGSGITTYVGLQKIS